MSDYADIANLSWDNIQEPKVLPVGSYLLRLSNAVFQPSKDADKNPVVMFVHVPKEAMADVDASALEDLGAEYDISENKIFTRIFIEDGSSWAKVRALLEKHDVTVSGSVVESLKKAKGAEVIGYLDQQRFQRKDGSAGESNVVTEFAKVDA